MSDTYQAVYDAIRSRIQGCDIGTIVSDAIRGGCDASHAIACIQQEFSIAAGEMQRPSVLYRPSLYPDGAQWCALYGQDLQNGVAGFGETPEKAMADFDAAWKRGRTRDAAAGES